MHTAALTLRPAHPVLQGATYGTCAYCGSTSTIPQAEDEQKLNRYNRANHFHRQCEFDKALSAYEKLLEQDDTDAEAHWGAVISSYGIEYVEDPATGRRVPTCHRVQVASILADAEKAHVEQMADQCAVKGYLSQEAVRALYEVDRTYTSTMAAWQSAQDSMLQRLKDRSLVRALQFATGALKARYQAALDGLTARMAALLREATEAHNASLRRTREEVAAAFARADAEAERLHADAAEQLARHQASVYEQACRQMEEATRLRSQSAFKKAAADFETLGSYGDSEQKRAVCLDAVERIYAEDKAALQLAEEKARKILLMAAMTAAVVLVVLLTMLMTKVIIPGNRYKEAEALLAAGQYQAASDTFAKAGHYSDAAERVREPYYVQAEALLAAGEYDAASEAFANAGDYSDAAERVGEPYYVQAEALLAEGKYEAASDAFASAGHYSDAAERVREPYYVQAEALLAAGDQIGAADAFIRAGGYQDATERSKELYYVQAEALLANGDQEGAAQAFTKAVGYQDALKHSYNLRYALGEGSVAAGDSHTVGLKQDGTVVAVGRNDDGQCDVSDWTGIGNSLTLD